MCSSRQSGRAGEFEATGPGAGGRQRCTQINSSSAECGAESISGLLQAIVQTRGIPEVFEIQMNTLLDRIASLSFE